MTPKEFLDKIEIELKISKSSPHTISSYIKANKELLRVLKHFIEKLGFNSIQCTIIRGHTSRTKVLFIENINARELQEKLKTLH